MELTPEISAQTDLPIARTIEQCHELVIPFMEARGFVFESGRHNSRSGDLHSGGTGWYAVFFRDDRETCIFCDNPILSWDDALHGTNFVDVVNLAACRALAE